MHSAHLPFVYGTPNDLILEVLCLGGIAGWVDYVKNLANESGDLNKQARFSAVTRGFTGSRSDLSVDADV